MLPLIAGIAGRAALSMGARAAAGTAARSAVTSAAESGAIRAGTAASAGPSSKVLSAMQFGNAASNALQGSGSDGGPAAAPSAPPPADDLGWARS